MSTTAQRNLAAAQWQPNGARMGALDLTDDANQIFGVNVFGPVAQRQHLPRSLFARLQRTLEKGEPLDLELADGVASAMRSWAMERGATHYTHWFQPLTNSTAEKHDSFFGPTGDGNAIAVPSPVGA